MARGWESKSVESQQDDARTAKAGKPPMSPAEVALEGRRRSLELALAHTQSELTAACRPAHREMLKLKLDAIRVQLGALKA